VIESWTVLKVLRWTTDYLDGKGITSPRLDAELLIGSALDKDRVGLYLCYDQPLEPTELAEIRQLVTRRANREPLQYILGHTEFWSLPFKVAPGVLIPRGDTEILVEEAIRLLEDAEPSDQDEILDVGTGSGAVAIALAHTFKQRCSAFNVTAIDISNDALTLARHNAQQNEVADQIHFKQHDMAHLDQLAAATGYRLIVSNPPYITSAEMVELMPEVLEHEPHLALEAGVDGLQCYRLLCAQAISALQPQGWLVVEVGATQATVVQELMEQAGLIETFQRQDYGGNARVVGGRSPEAKPTV